MYKKIRRHYVAIAALTRLTLLESWRARSGRLLLFALAAVQAIASLAAEMALTESLELRLVMCAFLYRLCLVFMLGVAMLSSVVREHESGFVQVLLAHPVSRLHYVIARMLGYCLTAFIAASAVLLVMALWVPPEQWSALLLWSMSLWLELIVTGAVALFLALGLRHMVGAMVMWLAFYIFARLLEVARQMAATPIGQDPNSAMAVAGQWLFQLMGWVIPPLGSFTRAEWLMGNIVPSASTCGILALWALIYAAVCTLAAAIDFYRHDI